MDKHLKNYLNSGLKCIKELSKTAKKKERIFLKSKPSYKKKKKNFINSIKGFTSSKEKMKLSHK